MEIAVKLEIPDHGIVTICEDNFEEVAEFIKYSVPDAIAIVGGVFIFDYGSGIYGMRVAEKFTPESVAITVLTYYADTLVRNADCTEEEALQAVREVKRVEKK